MELKKYDTEIIAKFRDDKGTYKIGLGSESLKMTDEELEALATQKYNEIKYREANPLPPTYQELRAKEYLAKGLTTDKLIIALWEKVVENRPEEADKIQAERIAIKQQIPKK